MREITPDPPIMKHPLGPEERPSKLRTRIQVHMLPESRVWHPVASQQALTVRDDGSSVELKRLDDVGIWEVG